MEDIYIYIEWTGENHERVKKNIASGTVRDTQRESTRSVCHFWTLVIGRRREVRIGLLFIAVILGSTKNAIFVAAV
jgi:hypothetical protein